MASVLGKKWIWVAAGFLVICLTMILLVRPSHNPIPEGEEFARIRSLPYNVKTMNCTHKATLYAKYLDAKGYTVWIAIGSVEGQRNEHAWVIVLDEEKNRWLYDPTGPIGGPSGYLEKHYATYHADLYCDPDVGIVGDRE